MSDKEKEVFSRKVSEEELADVSGGKERAKNCDDVWEREIYGGSGFPNCAATVEDGSFCKIDNDACHDYAIQYTDMKGCWFNDCHIAWK